MLKNAYSIQMSYQVTDEEKHQAERAILFFNHSQKLLNLASEHLNVMKTPFKDNQEIPSEEIMKVRAALRRFRDKAVDNFEEFKIAAFKAIRAIQQFSSDTQTIKIIKSFVSEVDELEVKLDKFVLLFKDLEDKEFVKNIVTSMEDIQKQCKNIEEIVEERVKKHIQNNILATSWIDEIGENLEIKLEKNTPIILQLFEERQKSLNDILNDKES